VASAIEDYGVIGDTRTVALVGADGSIDWWCAPRIDSPAVFAALLGDGENGRWVLRPNGDVLAVRRRYLPDTLVVETEYDTADGTVAVLDFMLPGAAHPTVFRVVEGRAGTVAMHLELVVRFDYGSIVPWVRRAGDGLTLVAGPDALRFHSPVPLEGQDHSTEAEFAVVEGERRPFSLAYYSSMEDPPLPLDANGALVATTAWWREWVGRCTYEGEWRDAVVRSLITLKALTYAPTGAVVAAATTSLPEEIGGVRNWDYRYSWLRDASYTLDAFLVGGLTQEAAAWSWWLRRALAGSPGDFQIMYDVYGRRRLTELELPWLAGYEGSQPVRIGNAATAQFQLDVFGEVMDTALTAARTGLVDVTDREHDILPAALEHLDAVWDQPDNGIWEVRGPRRHFTHSKVMAWVAYDRAITLAEELGFVEGPAAARVEGWRRTRDQIHAQVCESGWNERRGTFVQYYGGEDVDASLLMMARVGFLPPTDPRIVATVETIERELMVDGFVKRYPTDGTGKAAVDGGLVDGEPHPVDGLAGGEGTFLLTTFWLADNLALIGRRDDAVELFERVLALRGELGLLSEQYDPVAGRMLGNVPQAFSHLGVIITAAALS